MDKDTLKGEGKDVAGRIERQVGEWTDNEDMQIEGAGKQVEGKVQKAVGRVKEAGRDMADDMKKKRLREEEIKDRNRKVA